MLWNQASDGGPSQQFLISSSSKQLQVEVQDKVHILLACTPGLDVVHKLGVVHCIC